MVEKATVYKEAACELAADVAEYAQVKVDQAKEKYPDVKEKVIEQVIVAKEKAQDLYAEAKIKAANAYADAKDKAEIVKNKVNEAVEHAE